MKVNYLTNDSGEIFTLYEALIYKKKTRKNIFMDTETSIWGHIRLCKSGPVFVKGSKRVSAEEKNIDLLTVNFNFEDGFSNKQIEKVNKEDRNKSKIDNSESNELLEPNNPSLSMGSIQQYVKLRYIFRENLGNFFKKVSGSIPVCSTIGEWFISSRKAKLIASKKEFVIVEGWVYQEDIVNYLDKGILFFLLHNGSRYSCNIQEKMIECLQYNGLHTAGFKSKVLRKIKKDSFVAVLCELSNEQLHILDFDVIKITKKKNNPF